ncbi:MAG: ABC transporter permease [Actinomycetota bacterium]|nr:ABC transporter permease [Actinomycetota bacterium]
MSQFLEFTVLGLILGSVYAISATGLVVTYTTSGVFNFAHGAVGMIAAYGYWELVTHHVPAALAMVLIILVGAPLLGVIIEWLLMRRLLGDTGERPIMVTLGLLSILIGMALVVFGENRGDTLNPLVGGTFRILGVGVTSQDLVIAGAAAAIAVALRVLFHSFRLGVALRAVVDDPELLATSGASPVAMSRTGWVLGSVLAALAGVLLAQQQQTSLDTYTLALLVVSGFAAAVFGRLRSVPLTYAGGLVLGLAVIYFGSYAQPHLGSWGPDLSAALPMIFLFGVLIALPSVRLRAVGKLTTLRPPRVASGWESLVAAAAFFLVAVACSLTLSGTVVGGNSSFGVVLDHTMAYGIVGLSLVLLIGYAGQVSLCQFAFMGIGAFLMGKVAGGGSLLGLLLAVVVCAAIGALIALPTVRLRGLYFALATFAFADAAYTGIFPDTRVLGQGLNVGQIVLPGLSFGGNRAVFLLLAGAFVLSALLVLAIRRSLFGRRLVALQDSPAAYATVGLNAAFTKVAVFAIAAGLAGLAGALYGTAAGIVGTSDFDIFTGVIFVLFVVVWGVRTVSGAFLAALSFAVLTHVWTNGVGLFAGAGIVLIGWAPNGIIGMTWLSRLVPHRPGAGRRASTHDAASLVGVVDTREGDIRAAG